MDALKEQKIIQEIETQKWRIDVLVHCFIIIFNSFKKHLSKDVSSLIENKLGQIQKK